MPAPILVDFFCCAGGASMGYHRAGFQVLGVDKDPQPNYPFPFHHGDALDVLRRLIDGEAVPFVCQGDVTMLTLDMIAAVTASPPCQLFSKTKNTHAKKHVDLLTPFRPLLVESGLPYIIENVEGAPLINPVLLCATMFGLRAEDIDGVELQLQRHRLFESSFPVAMAPAPCMHDSTTVAGAYGGSHHKKPEHRDNPDRRGGYTPHKTVRAALLGIDWMRTEHELNQSIPPAYTEWLGAQAMSHIREKAAV